MTLVGTKRTFQPQARRWVARLFRHPLTRYLLEQIEPFAGYRRLEGGKPVMLLPGCAKFETKP